MSGRSVTITIGSTGSIRTTPVPRSSGAATLAGEKSKDKMYEPKHSQKMVRVLTVIAYMFTVSLAAIMLSVYYVCIWTPPYAKRMEALAKVQISASPAPSNATAEGVVKIVSTMSTSSGSLSATCSCPTNTVPSVGESFGSSENVEGNQRSEELSTDGPGSQPDVNLYFIESDVDRGPG